MNETTSLIKSYKGKNIRVNPVDRYTCLTDMANASGKQIEDWIRLKATSPYLDALSSMTGIPVIDLLIVGKGNQPTWAHPKVAIKFAAWCSPEFEVQVTSWIDELLTTGSVSIAPKTPLELAKEQVRLHEQLELQAAQIAILEQETERQAEIIDELFDYSSIVRIAIYNQINEKAFNWRQLKAASLVKGVEIKQAPCPRFVTKNLYHHDVWRLAYPGIALPETTTLVLAN
jgi:hypothetical protein